MVLTPQEAKLVGHISCLGPADAQQTTWLSEGLDFLAQTTPKRPGQTAQILRLFEGPGTPFQLPHVIGKGTGVQIPNQSKPSTEEKLFVFFGLPSKGASPAVKRIRLLIRPDGAYQGVSAVCMRLLHAIGQWGARLILEMATYFNGEHS